MIFSDEWSTPYSVWHNPSNCNFVCIYQGTQPTMEDYITNYDSSYNFSSPDILQFVMKFPMEKIPGGNQGNSIVTDPENEYYTQALKSFRHGTATWAVIFHYAYGQDPIYNLEGYYSLTDEAMVGIEQQIQLQLARPIYIFAPSSMQYNLTGLISIVPVSDLYENGVIKLRSIELVDPDDADEDRIIDMSISISIFKE